MEQPKQEEKNLTIQTQQTQAPSKEVIDQFSNQELLSAMNAMGMTKGLSRENIVYFIKMCQVFKLSPLKREVYAVTFKDPRGNVTFNVITAYQIYVERAYKTGMVDYYNVEVMAEGPQDDWYATCIIKRKDSSKEMVTKLWFKEYTTGQSTWLKKPRYMIEKCAISAAFRRAFPIELGDMPYTHEELWFHTKDSDEVVSANFNLEGVKSDNK